MNRTFSGGIRQVVAQYASGSTDPSKVIEYALRAANSASHLNSFARLTPETAISSANESLFRYHNRGQKSILDGIPIAIKDNFCTKDIKTTCASKMLENFVPTYNATVVERLLNAGAVLVGKTNMDEFSMGSGAVESIYGPVKNVWSRKFEGENWRIAGGSSGGSANAIAAGVCFAAIGSDTGGSTRIPAGYCGVLGFKPTYGLVSRYGLIPLAHSMDVPGIFALNVDDCVAILNAISGPDKRDSTTFKEIAPKVELPFLDELNVKDVKVGIPKECYCGELLPEILDTWKKIADMLEDAGACVEQVSLPNFLKGVYVYAVLNQCEVASNMACYDGIEYGLRAEDLTSTEELYAKSRGEGFNTVVKTRIVAGNYYLLKRNYDQYYIHAMKARRVIACEFEKVFTANKIDVLLLPTTLTDAPLYGDFKKNSFRDQCAINDLFTAPANLAGIPALSIPIRLSSRGLPLSLQLMGDKMSENLLLRVGKWIESRVNFKDTAPPDSVLRMVDLNIVGAST